MNGLSWMIYFAGVSEGLSILLAVAGIIMLIIFFIRILIAAADAPFDETEAAKKEWRSGHKPALLIAIPCLLVSALLPSDTTLYAIAASQYGEKLASTETANKAVQALNIWLDKQIAQSGK